MNFTVAWEPDARRELHLIWAASADPAAVRAAATAAEQLLGTDPVVNGQHLTEGLWKVAVPPLVVYYEVNQAQASVTISNVVYTVPFP